jgi:DNA-binding LytR/AlgR family response regulator
MNLSCYVVDDEYHSIDVLKAYIEKSPGLELKGSSTDPLFALNEVASSDSPQITFLDVDMPELSGMAFAGMVSVYTKVIFTTSYREYAIEAFEKDAVDYLLKPISYERFLKAVNKVKKLYLQQSGKTAERTFFYIKSDLKGKLVKINIRDIFYAEASQNYILIHVSKGKHMAYLTMEEIEEYLPRGQFLRVHRSFIINLEMIRTVENGQVTLEGGAILPLGRAYKEPLILSMKEALLQSRRNTGG